MHVAIFNGGGRPVTIENVPDQDLQADEIRISIARCGICGSDVAFTGGSPFDYAVGARLGHEFSGEVIEVGRSVSKLKVGDKIAALPGGPCGSCDQCRADRPVFCHRARAMRGGFGERLVMPASSGYLLPSSVSFAEGALVEPMACGRRALRMASIQKGDRLLVLGAGNVALSLIYWGRLMEAGRIVVATRSAKRDEVALAMGADAALRLSDEDPGSVERALGGPPDVVAECIGKPGMLALAIRKVRLGGAVLSMGMCTAPEHIIPALGTFKEVSLHFPLAYSVEDFIKTIRAFDAGKVRPEMMVSETIALPGLPAMIEELRGVHEHLKVQVIPNKD